MAGLFVYRSNRLEALGAHLAEVLRTPLPNPLQTETVVVQSPGMGRWVSFELASRLGVSMNCRFPFFQEFAHGILHDGAEEENAFSRTALPWRILSRLTAFLEQPGCEPLRHYTGTDTQAELKRFQLARQIGTIFDRYLAYSPDRLLRWERGEEAHWQAMLWRELSSGAASAHPPAMLRRFISRIEAGESPLTSFSPRVSVFGISTVPPFYLHLLSALSRLVDVHLYLLVATDQYWGDLTSEKEQRRILRKPALAGKTADELHFESGNELLVSLGKPGKAFIREVAELQPHGSPDIFFEPAGNTLLSAIQRDIYQVSEPASDEELGGHGAPQPIDFGDASVQIHCCHGPMRELQVLHDRLLRCFETIPGLMPKDVLVTMPDVEAYAPFIEAVFATSADPAQRLPFSIADRSARAESSVAGALLQLVEMHGGRFGASSVLALLEIAPIRERFGIEEEHLDLLREWVDAAGICWGIDGRHRAEVGSPPFEHNSWRAGLSRLLLGYALPGDGETLYRGTLPYPEIEGSQAVLLGAFAEFCESLFEKIPALETPRTLDTWERTLRDLLQTFVADTDAFGDELKRIRSALRQLGALSVSHPEPVSFAVLRAHLATVLGDTDAGFGFLAGHITFCSLKPMRSVPFRVICILGLDDTAFPRQEQRIGFDLLALEGKGPSRRDDDRQLFLENILSARDVLILSYSGLSPKDNSEAPPSTVVSDMLDYVSRNYTRDGSAAGLEITRHPLQPFSPRYFAGKEAALFSYSQEACAASIASRGERHTDRTLLPVPLALPAEFSREIGARTLIDFFANPSRYFIEQRLRVRLPEQEEEQDDCEPMALDGLARWHLQKRLAKQGSAAGAIDVEMALEVTRAEGVLPGGWFGRSAFESLHSEVGSLLGAARAAEIGDPVPPRNVRVEVGAWRVNGAISELFTSGHVRLHAWKVKAKNRVEAWITHLLLCTVVGTAAQLTRVIGTDRIITFSPVEEAETILAELLALYEDGNREPLPFFPEVSWLMAKADAKGGDDRAARKEWATKTSMEPFERLCHGGQDPLDERWREIALRVYRPMLAHSHEEKLP